MRTIDADALVSRCGDYYVEEGPEHGFIGTLKCLVDMQPTIGGWISVKDRLPNLYHIVLITGRNCVGGSLGVIKGSYDGDKAGWYRDDVAQYAKSREDVITHWMPLPEPPKEEKHESDRMA